MKLGWNRPLGGVGHIMYAPVETKGPSSLRGHTFYHPYGPKILRSAPK